MIQVIKVEFVRKVISSKFSASGSATDTIVSTIGGKRETISSVEKAQRGLSPSADIYRFVVPFTPTLATFTPDDYVNIGTKQYRISSVQEPAFGNKLVFEVGCVT